MARWVALRLAQGKEKFFMIIQVQPLEEGRP